MIFKYKLFPNWKTTLCRSLERDIVLFKQSGVFLLAFAITAIAPTAVSAGELDELKPMIEQMEVRHQQEMEPMHKQIEALTKAQEQQTSESEQVAELRDEIESLHEGAAERKTEDERFSWGAFPGVAYEDFEDEDSTFEGEIDFFARLQLTDRLAGFAQLEFHGAGHGQEEEGAEGAEIEIELEQAYLEYTYSEAFKPTFGVVLVPWGRYNKRHFDPVNDFHSQPLVFTSVTPGTWKEVGAGFSGRKGIGKWAVNYEAYVVNGIGDEITDTAGEHGSIGADNNNNKAWVGRLGFEPTRNLEIGVSGYHGEYDSGDDSTIYGLGADFDFNWKEFELKGEYSMFNLEDGEVEDHEIGDIEAPEDLYGYYIEGNYHFWPSFLKNSFLTKQFPNSVLTASLRYGMAHRDDDGDDDEGEAVGDRSDPDNEEKRFSIGLNYRPVESWVWTTEYLFNNTDNEALVFGDADGFIFSISGHF